MIDNKANEMEKIYITNDVECAGSRVGLHSVLSWGACVVTAEPLSREERLSRGLAFYAELQPVSDAFEIEAMRVGSSGLHCLKDRLGDPRYDTASPEFEPALVLQVLKNDGLSPKVAVGRFMNWLRTQFAESTEIIPIVDTVFFDPCFIQWIFTLGDQSSPYGWSGIDLDSLYRGYAQNMDGNLRELGLTDSREVAHCALDDAMFLADIARELIFGRIKRR